MSDLVHIVCPHCDAINRAPREKLKPGVAGKCGSCGKPLFEGHPLALDEGRFTKHAANSDIPLLVDFWAPWCGPCRVMAPMFEEAAKLLEPTVRLAKVNTEEAQALAARHHIRSIPTLALFHKGREIARQVGVMDTAGLKKWVAQHV